MERSKEKAVPLVNEGAKLLDAPMEAFNHGQIVFSTVSNDEAFRAITEGPGGLLENAKAGMHSCIHEHSLAAIMKSLLPSINRKVWNCYPHQSSVGQKVPPRLPLQLPLLENTARSSKWNLSYALWVKKLHDFGGNASYR